MVALLLLVIHRIDGPFTYTAEATRFRIVDERTGEGVEGVTVVALWNMTSVLESAHAGYLYSYETLTDPEGYASIPAMPRKLRWFWCRLEREDPRLLMYKPGFFLADLDNRDAYIRPITMKGTPDGTTRLPDNRIVIVGSYYSKESRRFSYWNGKAIPMRGTVLPVETQVQDYEYVRDIADHDLNPARFPLLWQTLTAAYDRFDPITRAKSGHSDPREFAEFYGKQENR